MEQPSRRAEQAPALLGNGLQFNVYDLGNGRVRKVPRPFEERLALTTMWGESHPLYAGEGAAKAARDTEKHITYSFKHLQKIADTLDQAFIGHPKFFPDGSYEQDKVIMLDDYFEQHALEENKRAIDGFIDAVLTQWKHHFCEWTFNFLKNYGVDAQGHVILADIAELHFARSNVQRMVARQNWLHCGSVQDLEDPELKAYHHEQAKKRLTQDAFDALWPKTR